MAEQTGVLHEDLAALVVNGVITSDAVATVGIPGNSVVNGIDAGRDLMRIACGQDQSVGGVAKRAVAIEMLKVQLKAFLQRVVAAGA